MTILKKILQKSFKDFKNQKSTTIILILIHTDLLTLFELLNERGKNKITTN